MTEFMPPPYPRALVLGLFEHEGRILVFESRDPRRDLVFYRPLGGGIEFGEHSREALVREVQEELGLQAEPLDLVGVMENRFTHQGRPGHEIVFVYHARFLDPGVYEGPVAYVDGRDSDAVWVLVADFVQGRKVLFPEGLSELLK